MSKAETRDTWPLGLPAHVSIINHLLSPPCDCVSAASCSVSPAHSQLLTIWLIAVLCLMSGLCQVSIMWMLQAADGTYKLETRYVDGRVKGMNIKIWRNIYSIDNFQASTDTLTPRVCWERPVTAPRPVEDSNLRLGKFFENPVLGQCFRLWGEQNTPKRFVEGIKKYKIRVSTSTSIGIISKAPAGHHTDKDLVIESASICYVTWVEKRTKWKGGIWPLRTRQYINDIWYNNM